MYGKMKPFLDALSTVLVIVAATAVLWQMYRKPRPPEPPPPVEDVALSLPASSVRHVRGAGSVVLVEFGDYECPFCGRHASTVAPEIEREFVESGLLQQVFLNYCAWGLCRAVPTVPQRRTTGGSVNRWAAKGPRKPVHTAYRPSRLPHVDDCPSPPVPRDRVLVVRFARHRVERAHERGHRRRDGPEQALPWTTG